MLNKYTYLADSVSFLLFKGDKNQSDTEKLDLHERSQLTYRN